jgi:hypothetical protein
MEWLPSASTDVAKVATPELFNVPVPRVVEPSMNMTEPVEVPEPGVFAETVAVNVTDWPNLEGLCEEVTAVEVASWFTV